MAVHTCTHDVPSKLITTGSTVNFTGLNHDISGTVTVYFNGVKAGTASTNGTGGFTYALTVPTKKDYGSRCVVTLKDVSGHTTNHEFIVPN